MTSREQTLYNLLGVMVTIDFEKVFDSLSCNFLFKTLESPSLSGYVSFYTNISSCIKMNNVVPTLLFSVGSVVKQRDPLSPYLFILALQTLLTTVKQNQDIKGIVVENKEIKCIPFASDLTNLLCDKESSDSLSSLLNTYGECSGLKLDQDKKESYWIGR